MPNSEGCIHAYLDSVENTYRAVLKISVEVRENLFSGKDYPYKPQGIAIVEPIDWEVWLMGRGRERGWRERGKFNFVQT